MTDPSSETRNPPETGTRLWPRLRGGLCSLLLHGLALSLLLWLGLPAPPPPETETAVPVDLVPLGEETTAPPAPQKAPQPQEAAPVPPQPQALPAAPKPLQPPHLPQPPQPHRRPAGDRQPRREPLPSDDFDSRLQAIERRQRQSGAGSGTVNAGAAAGRHAAVSVKDLVRAQIERHWNFDVGQLGGGEQVVSLHLRLGPDGTVLGAEILDDPRYATDPLFHQFANSARRAAQVASPLDLPPGRADEVRELTLTLRSREVLR